MSRAKKKWIGFPLLTIALVVAACVTINVYFPEKEIEDLSQRIEEEVQKRAAQIEADGAEGKSAEPPADPGEKPPPGRSGLLDVLFGVTPAYAYDVPAPEVSNPAIRTIIESRAARVDKLDEYKAREVIGENNRALVEIRELDRVEDLRERAALQKLGRGENDDRERLFEEIAAAKNVDLSQLPRIRETYAATLRANARKGDWIQLPDGQWSQK